MRLALTALAAASLAAPSLALAQDTEDAPEAIAEPAPDFIAMAEELQNPAKQRELALMLRTVSEVLLDLPLAPLMESVSEVSEDVTGEPAPEVDPDATLRSMAPEAENVPEQIEENLPRALDAMGSMAEAFQQMMPALHQMAERMKDAVPTRAE